MESSRAEMSVRPSIPLGTHEVLVQASDSYGETTGFTSIAISLAEGDSPLMSTDGDFLSTGVLIGILALFGLVACSDRDRLGSQWSQAWGWRRYVRFTVSMHQRPITVYTPARWNEYLCERSVAVITERCQRLNPGSNPGARTKNPSQRRTAQFF